SAHRQPALAAAVAVDVGDRLSRQFLFVLLDPLRRAEQAPFLAVPRCEDDGALRLPPGLQQRAEAARGFHERDVAARRVRRAVHPRVVMVAVDDPLVGELRAVYPDDDVVGRSGLPHERPCETAYSWT